MKISFIFSFLNLILILFLLVAIDQIFYYSNNKDSQAKHEFLTIYRHGGLINLYHKPTEESIQIANKNFDKSEVRFQTNLDGAILPIGGNGKKKVFFVGGSTTENHWVPDLKRWPYLVGESTLLRDKIKTYNYGVGGYNIHQNFQKFYSYLSSLNPDYVIIMNQINDIGKGLNGGYYNLKNDVPLHNSFELKKNRISFKLKLKKFVKLIIPSSYSIINQLKTKQNSKRSGTYSKENINETLSDYLNRLDLFKILTDHLNIEMILMSQPNISHLLLSNKFKDSNPALYLKNLISEKGMTNEEYLEVIKLFNEAIKNYSEKNKIKLIDLKQKLPQDEIFFYDSIHFTQMGSEKVSEIVSYELSKIIE